MNGTLVGDYKEIRILFLPTPSLVEDDVTFRVSSEPLAGPLLAHALWSAGCARIQRHVVVLVIRTYNLEIKI